jgi:transcriptional regulator with XRE-family HTH domain
MSSVQDRLTQRIRTECARRGWDLQSLAQRADISRTALYHLLEGHTARPRGVTLSRLAAAFDIPVEQLLNTRDEPAPSPLRVPATEAARQFDRDTNPEVDAVAAERPQLFSRWTDSDWDELYSTFGSGGALNRQGVIASAEAINRKRETIRRLHLVLDTHLRVVAEELIDTLYRQVRPQSNLASGETLRTLLAEAHSTHHTPENHDSLP